MHKERFSLMKKMLFIMNPYSGQRRANRYLSDIIGLFNRYDYEVTVHMTSGCGDAADVARTRGKDYDVIVCCGGDGTFNETVSGMLTAGLTIPVGYIPSGSTNDFAASMHLPTNVMDAARLVAEGTPTPYDVGKFGDRYFAYVASFGAFTRASYATPQNVKNALGHTAYVLEGITELSQIRKTGIRLDVDGTIIEDDFIFGAISNSTSVGGILTLSPDVVDMSDGLLEVLLVRAPKSLLEIHECIQAVQTQKYNCSMITFLSGHHIKIWADPDMPWTLDGEREDGHAQVDIVNQHLAIHLIQRGTGK